VGGCWRTRTAVAGLGGLSLVGYAAGVPWVAAAAEPQGAYVALFVPLFVLYLLAVWVVRRRPSPDRVLLGLILTFGLFFRAVLLPTPVVLSSDVYRYLWDGRVQWAGVSPYRYPPAAPELTPLRDPAIHPHVNRPASRTVYPPGAEALFAAVVGIAPDSLLAWRLVLLGCEVATGALLLDLLHRLGRPVTAVVVYAWAPLAVFEGVQAAHLEVAWIPLALLALRWRQAGATLRAGLALGAAILVKLVPAVLLVAWWRRGDRRMPLACAVVVAAGYLAYLGGAGPYILGFLPEYLGSGEDFNIGLRYFLTGWIPLERAITREAVRGIAMLVEGAALAVVLTRIARARTEDPEGVLRAAMAAAAASLILLPTALHAWYALWIVPFLCVTLSPAWLWFSGAVALSYLKYVSPSGELPLWARTLEFFPLYGLLVWEWWTGRAGVPAYRAVALPRTR
jgi:alpha-1,6-mannosyltransferase